MNYLKKFEAFSNKVLSYRELSYPQDLPESQTMMSGFDLLISSAIDSNLLRDQVEKTITEILKPGLLSEPERVGGVISKFMTLWSADKLKRSFSEAGIISDSDFVWPWETSPYSPTTIEILEVNGIKVYLFDGHLFLDWVVIMPDEDKLKVANKTGAKMVLSFSELLPSMGEHHL